MVNGYSPLTLDEALKIRAEQDVVPYAGGTDLMVQNRKGVSYLFLNKIDELKNIVDDDEYIRIGACVTFTKAMENPLVPQMLKEAASRIASPAIRNAGTFGGNLGNASDKADSVLVEFAMSALIRLVSVNGERLEPVEKFSIRRRETDIHSDELIAEILIPKKMCSMPYYYKKVGGRNSLAISHIAFSGLFEENDGVITHISWAVIADAGLFLRFRDIEAMFIGKTLDEAKAIKEEATGKFAERLQLTRGRVTAQYRRTVSLNLLRDFLDSFIG